MDIDELYRMTRWACKDEDLVQTVMLNFVKNIYKLDLTRPAHEQRAWCFRRIKMLRKNYRPRKFKPLVVEPAYEHKFYSDESNHYLSLLTEKERDIAYRVFGLSESHREVAKSYQCSFQNISQICDRIKQKLMKYKT